MITVSSVLEGLRRPPLKIFLLLDSLLYIDSYYSIVSLLLFVFKSNRSEIYSVTDSKFLHTTIPLPLFEF